MRSLPRGFLGVLSALVLGLPCVAAGKLWIVSKSGCPGVDFSEIQPAIVAATSGDVILVRGEEAGTTYGPLAVRGKSLTIVGDGGGPIRITATQTGRSLSLANQGQGQHFVLRGIAQIDGRIDLRNNGLAPVWLEDCGVGWIDARDTAALFVTRSRVFGGIEILRSTVSLYASTVTGPTGPSTIGGSGVSVTGGPGIELLAGGTLFASGGSITGGLSGYTRVTGPLGGLCAQPGTGGPGIQFSDPTGTVYSLATQIRGGDPAQAIFNRECGLLIGNLGPQTAGVGTLQALSGSYHGLVTDAPALEGDPVDVTLTGDGGDWSQLFTSPGVTGSFLPFLNGTLIPQLPGVAANLGFLPPSGTLSFEATVPVGVVDPGQAFVLFGQGLFANPAQQVFLGAPSVWVFLDEDHDPNDGC